MVRLFSESTEKIITLADLNDGELAIIKDKRVSDGAIVVKVLGQYLCQFLGKNDCYSGLSDLKSIKCRKLKCGELLEI